MIFKSFLFFILFNYLFFHLGTYFFTKFVIKTYFKKKSTKQTQKQEKQKIKFMKTEAAAMRFFEKQTLTKTLTFLLEFCWKCCTTHPPVFLLKKRL